MLEIRCDELIADFSVCQKIPLILQNPIRQKNTTFKGYFHIITFPCESTGNFISSSYLCDGVNDCLNGEDEIDCPIKISFSCKNSSSRQTSFVNLCNFHEDCNDGSDENVCCEYDILIYIPYFIRLIHQSFYMS